MAWYDEYNQRNQTLANQGVQQVYQPAQQTKQQPSQKKSSGLASLLPSGGGIGGALAGGAAGAALGSVVPIIGTGIGGLIGSILGGAGGSALGKFGENAVEGEKDLGKGVAQEALLGGITSTPIGAIGKVTKAGLQGGKALLTGAEQAAAKNTLAEAGRLSTPKAVNRILDNRAVNKGANIVQAGSKSSKIGSILQKQGADLLGSQANLTRAEARKIGTNPSQVLSNIHKRTGVGNLDTAAEIGKNVTGEGGAYSELVRNAIGNSKGVDISDLRNVTNDALDNMAPLLSSSQRKNIITQVSNGVTGTYGGAKGSLNPLANPLEAFNLSKSFRSMASDISKGANVSAADKQLAKVYNHVGKTIEDKLYSAPGVEEGFKAAAPDRAKDLRALAAKETDKSKANAYNKLADELQSAKSIKDVRSLQKDFVDVSKIDEATARAQAGAGDRLGGGLQGLGKYFQKPLNLAAIPAEAATPKVGGALLNAAEKSAPKFVENTGLSLSKGVNSAKVPGQGILGMVTRNQIERPLLSGITGGAEEQQTDQSQLPQGTTSNGLNPGDIGYEASFVRDNPQSQDQSSIAGSLQGGGDVYSKENIQNLVAQDLQQTGGKNVNTLLSLYKTFGQESSDLSAQQQKSLSAAQSGQNALDQIAELYSKTGGAQGPLFGSLQNFAGSTGLNSDISTYNQVGQALVAQIAKALGNSGTLSDKDIKIVSGYIPKLTDTPDTAQAKLQSLQNLLNNAQQNATTDYSKIQ